MMVTAQITCYCLEQETVSYVLNGARQLLGGTLSLSLSLIDVQFWLYSPQHDYGNGLFSGRNGI